MAPSPEEQAAAAAAAQAEAEAKAALWSLAAAIPSIRSMVPITLDLQTSNYLQWRGMFTDALQKYALEDHILASAYPANPTPQWSRLDAIVRSWLNGAVAPELLAMVVDTTVVLPAHTLWSRLSSIYHDNAETRSSYLEQEFHGLQQGAMTVGDYCRKQKALADELNAMGTTTSDRSLVQNTLRGLGQRLAYMRTLLLKQRPFPTFLDVRSSLLLEELTLVQSDASPTAFVARSAAPAPLHQSGTDNPGGTRRSAELCRNFQQRGSCRFGARCKFTHVAAASWSRNNGSSSNNTTAGANRVSTAPWPSPQNPWAGSIHMWPGPWTSAPRPPGASMPGPPHAYHAAMPHAYHAAMSAARPPPSLPTTSQGGSELF
jgi:hypothetical protein